MAAGIESRSSSFMFNGLIDEQGFAIFPHLLSDGDIEQLAKALADANLLKGRAGMRQALRVPVVAEIVQQPQLLAIAREILGNEAVPFRATWFDKSPRANWLVAWHQDRALPLRRRHEMPGWGPWSVKEGVIHAHAPASALRQVLALRFHIDDSNADNGPLRVLPGSHKAGVLSDEEIHKLTARTSPVECLVAKGGVLAMRPLIVHASSKSQSERPRRVLHVEYASSQFIADGIELAKA
jgi:ectoine hydroxylase-related dioxygenase (phytanoyl-CoA dioxygenase family)